MVVGFDASIRPYRGYGNRLHTQAGALRLVTALVELVVVAGQDSVQQDTGDGGDGQTGQVDVNARNRKRDAAHRVEAQGADQNDRGNDQVAGVGEVDLVLDNVRTPMAEIMPYSTKLIPPTMPEGIVLMMASNFGQKLRIIANTAAMRMTRGS